RYAMEQALAAHRGWPNEVLPQVHPPPRTVEQYAAAGRLKENACIHCHQVYDFRREDLQANGRWRQHEVWVYPLPENIGLTLAIEQGNRVTAVRPNSPADRAGLRTADVLRSLNGWSVASIADVAHALHRAPAAGSIRVEWRRADRDMNADLSLPE